MSVEMPEAEVLEKSPDPPLDSPVTREPGKNFLLNQQTFLLTVSPKGDVSSECEKLLLKWLGRATEYLFCVAERGKNGQRHLHMCAAFGAPRSKQVLQEETWRRVKRFHGDSIGKFACVVTTMYDHKWYDEYLRKESGVEILYDAYDRDAVEKMFPPPEVQQLFIESKGKKVCDTYMHEHCLLWSETSLPVSVSGALRYLRERMFKEKSMMVIQDERRVRQLALAIYRYRTGDCEPSPEDDDWLNRCDPVRGSLYVHGQQSAAPP